MPPLHRLALPLAAVLFLAASARAAAPADDPVLRAMRDELARATTQLRLEGGEPPYFAAYRVEDSISSRVAASFGALVSRDPSRPLTRRASIELRVGTPALDQTSFAGGGVGGGTFSTSLPIEDNYAELRRQLWLATDNAYKAAIERLSRKKAALQNRNRTDDTPDFTSEPPTQTTDSTPPRASEPTDTAALARELSAVFREFPAVANSSVSLSFEDSLVRYLNSEGTTYTHRESAVILVATAVAPAADGRSLQDHVLHIARSTNELPPKAELLAEVRLLGKNLTALRDAPLIETYNGPVLFEGAAATEVFAQVFAPQLTAVKLPVVENARGGPTGNPLMDRIGARVLPDFLDVTDDPTRAEFNGMPLFASEKIDDEGVPTRTVKLVEAGRLKALLTSRVPARGFLKSTGSRHGSGASPTNLLVTVREGLTADALKAELLKVAAQRNKDYAVIVREISSSAFGSSGGGGRGGRGGGQGGDSGAIEPAILAYKVFPDGREELLRHVDISGVTLSAFKDILAAGTEAKVRNLPLSSARAGGRGGAEIVSLAVPSLLFDEVTLKRPTGDLPKLPVAKHPYFDK